MEFFKKPGKLASRVCGALLGGAMLVSLPSIASAQEGEAFDTVDQPFELSTSLLGEDSPFQIGGWTQIGYHDKSNGVFNTHPGDVNLHQQWLYAERVADGSDGLDFGFRFDAVYGVDGPNTQAFGNPPGTYDFDDSFTHGIYGWALPQVYGEVAYGDLSVKVGHFYTIIGYETVTAPDNFFYSHAFTFNFNEPFTHTGVLSTYNLNDDITLWNGWTAGWDTGFEDFNDGDDSDGSNYLGGVSVNLTDTMTAIWACTIGDFGVIGEGYMNSYVFDWSIADDLNYVFQFDYLHTNAASPVGGDGGTDSHSFNQYLFYTVNDWMTAGARGEIWTVEDQSYYECTLGLNLRPDPNVVIRPEVRWQEGLDATATGFFDRQFGLPANNAGEAIFGVDAILTY